MWSNECSCIHNWDKDECVLTPTQSLHTFMLNESMTYSHRTQDDQTFMRFIQPQKIKGMYLHTNTHQGMQTQTQKSYSNLQTSWSMKPSVELHLTATLNPSVTQIAHLTFIQCHRFIIASVVRFLGIISK